MPVKNSKDLYERIRQILESPRVRAARSVNTTQVIANWLVGREIVEEEQLGRKKAVYGQKLIAELSEKLQKDFGSGYSATNLKLFRQFFLEYPDLLSGRIGHTLRDQSLPECETSVSGIIAFPTEIGHTSCDQSWKPGLLHPNLSWSLYRHLVGVESTLARSFYEIEAIRNNWSARELERQINSLLYERLSLSKDKKGVMRPATKGQVIQRPIDVFKDPVVMEFLDLPPSPKLAESDLEEALINNLQAFLMELGKGGKKAYQSQVDFDEGKVFLLRAIVNDSVDPAVVITAYRTSKISKYWRTT